MVKHDGEELCLGCLGSNTGFLISCVTLGQSLNLSVPQFPQEYMDMIIDDACKRLNQCWLPSFRDKPPTAGNAGNQWF